jgi:hypothetical protein
MISYFIILENINYIIYNKYSVFKGVVKLARIINQNNEVIAKKSGNEKKATVSITSLIVGISLSIAAIAVIIVVILFLTKKNKDDKKNDTTPLIQYIQNYKGRTKSENKIVYLTDGIGNVKYELENFTGECYILIYDKTWMTSNEKDSNIYTAYEKIDSALTGSKTSAGKEMTKEPMLRAIENCGRDIKFFVVDFKAIEKSDNDKSKDPVYFTMGGIQFANLNAPMLFHYKSSETYDSMNDSDLLVVDGQESGSYWVSKIKNEVDNLNKIDSNTEDNA